MSKEIEDRIERIPLLRSVVRGLKRIKLPWLEGFSLYDLLELYILGILEGAFSYHASAVSFSFFMALFPFTLFILNLIPFIPIEGFQADFLLFVQLVKLLQIS
jgi:membrane protein